MRVFYPDRIGIWRCRFLWREENWRARGKSLGARQASTTNSTHTWHRAGIEPGPALITASSLTPWSNQNNFWWLKLIVSYSAGPPLQLDCEFRTSFSPKNITVRIKNLRLCPRSFWLFGTKSRSNCFVYKVILHHYWKQYLRSFGLSFECWTTVT